MKRLLTVVAVLGAACAGASRQTSPPGAPNTICMPCGNACQFPCTPGETAVAAAPKAAPKPAPAPVQVAAPVQPPPPPAEPVAATTFDPPGGPMTGRQMVTLSTSTPGAVIHYTTDGTDPSASSPVYSAPIPVEGNTTLKAIASAPGAPDSPIATSAYTVAAPTPPPAPETPRVTVTKEKLELKDKVFFRTGKSIIDPKSDSLLDEVATALQSHDEVKHVVVEGHTDSSGSAKLNRKLSLARARAVRKYLVDKGVTASRLDARGFGPSQPVADNDTPDGREQNRRVEFIIR